MTDNWWVIEFGRPESQAFDVGMSVPLADHSRL